jgi:hypothetical protein
MCSWHSPIQKTQKGAEFFKRPFLKQIDGPTPMKSVTFCWIHMDFFTEEIMNMTSNLTPKKEYFVSTEGCQRCRALMDEMPPLWSQESVAVLGLNVMFREAHSTSTLQVWYLSIDIHFRLSYVGFENGLSISVLQTKTTRHQN